MSGEAAEQTPAIAPDDHAAAWAAAEALVEGADAANEDGASEDGGAGDVEANPSPAAGEDGEKESANAEGDDAGSDDDEEDKNEGKVTPAERVGFRAEKRKWREKKAAEQAAIAKEREGLQGEFQSFRRAQELEKSGDPEGAIEALFGRPAKDVIGDIVKIAKGKDPKVERELAEARRYREEQEKQRQQQQLQQQRAQLQQRQLQWAQANIVTPLKADETTAGLAEEPVFVQAVFAEMQAEYDPEEDATIPLKEAVKRAKQKLRQPYERLQRIFGGHPTSADESADSTAPRSGKAAAKNGRRVRALPNSRATSASGTATPPDPSKDPQGWMKWAEAKMRADAAEEKAATKR